MFEPNLDNGSAWESVGGINSPPGLFNYTPEINLDIRSDALRVNVTMDTTRDTWELAGVMVQLWEVSSYKYQTKYSKIWLKQKTIFSVEPLANSILVFKPVTWLKDWTLNIEARPYQPKVITEQGLNSLEENLSNFQQQVSIGFSDLKGNIAESLSSGTLQRVTILNQLDDIQTAINVLSERVEEIRTNS